MCAPSGPSPVVQRIDPPRRVKPVNTDPPKIKLGDKDESTKAKRRGVRGLRTDLSINLPSEPNPGLRTPS